MTQMSTFQVQSADVITQVFYDESTDQMMVRTQGVDAPVRSTRQSSAADRIADVAASWCKTRW
jgi:hypothetical protein